jgi:AsmA family protein
MRRWLRWFGIAIGVIFALFIGIPAIIIAVVALLYDWDDARPLVGRLATAALGREVAITDGLDVDLGRVTRIDLQGLTVANVEGGRSPHLVRIGDLVVAIALKPLLSGNVVIPELRLADVDAALERNAQGRANWEFGADAQPAAEPAPSKEEPMRLPLIESLTVSGASINLDDRQFDKHASLVINNLQAGENDERTRMTAEGSGTYQGRPASLKATMGSLTVLREGGQPYPLDVTFVAGDFHADVAGTLADPLELEGLNLDLDIKGDDVSNLFPLIGVPMPPTPPYRLVGRLERKGTRWAFKDFAGTLGTSDMRGNAAVDTGGKPLRLEANTSSKLLDLKDLAGFIGASEGGASGQVEAEAKPDTGRVLPNKNVELTQLRAMDAKINFKGTRVVTPEVPIDQLDAHVSLEDGTLRLEPVSFAIGKGQIKLFLSLYGSEQPVRTDIDTVIQQLDIKRLLQGSEMVKEMAGTFNGRAKLAATGTSVADILGSATGSLMVVLEGGRFSRLLVEAMGLDVAEALGTLIEGDQSIPIHCIVADFAANDGLFDSRTLIFDTTDTNVVGSGTINMRDEALDLRLRAYPKDFSPLTLRTPISVQGTFKSPQAFPDPADTGVETTVQKILAGVLTVITGLLPPVDIGPGKDAPCEQLIRQARQRVGSDTGRGRPAQ